MVGLITHIQRFSIHDGPGIRTTVFFKGCPLACRWCQNPEAVTDRAEVLFHAERCAGCGTCIDVCPQGCFTRRRGATSFGSADCDFCGLCIEHCPSGALAWSAVAKSAGDVLDEVLRDRVFYEISGGGMTLSGGEPLRQIGFCLELLGRAKRAGLHTALDTSGCVPFESIRNVLARADLFLYDIKFVDAALHERYTGSSNELILENFRRLGRSGKAMIVRIPLIPGVTDRPENLEGIERFVHKYAKGTIIEKIPYNPLMEKKYLMLGKKSPIGRVLPKRLAKRERGNESARSSGSEVPW